MVHKKFCREPNPDFCTQIFRNDGRSWGRIMVRYGQPRSGPDRDRPRPTDFGPSRVEPILSVRLGPGVFPGPIGPVHLDLWDRPVRSKFTFPSVRPIGPTDWTEVFVA